MESKEVKVISREGMIDDGTGIEYEVIYTKYSDHKEIEVYSEETDISFNLSYKDKMDLEHLVIELALENIKLKDKIENVLEDLK